MKTTEIQIGANENCTFDIKKFNTSTGIISASYQHYLQFENKFLKQISVDLYYREIDLDISKFENSKNAYAIVISRWLDWEQHFAKPVAAQKLEILDTLQDSMMLMCDKYGFDKIPFELAYQRVIEKNFEHRELLNKFTWAKDRQHRAAIEIDLQEDGARVNVLIINKQNIEIAKREVVRLKPHYYFIHQLIYKGKWLDNQKYIVSNKNEVVNFVVNLNSEKVELDIRSVKMSREEVLKKLEELKV